MPLAVLAFLVALLDGGPGDLVGHLLARLSRAAAALAGLAVLLGMGFLAFKRNLIQTSETKKELQDLKGEFEAYRKSAREAREKMSMDHFNEIRKLKGG